MCSQVTWIWLNSRQYILYVYIIHIIYIHLYDEYKILYKQDPNTSKHRVVLDGSLALSHSHIYDAVKRSQAKASYLKQSSPPLAVIAGHWKSMHLSSISLPGS